jgi:hypothetical protein
VFDFGGIRTEQTYSDFAYDVFICHASEDAEVADNLGRALIQQGLQVWLDSLALRVGDSLTQEIAKGLSTSRFGIVLISKAFFEKGWANFELAGLLQRHVTGTTKVLLPVWVDVTRQDVLAQNPSLADVYAARLEDGYDSVAAELVAAMQEAATSSSGKTLMPDEEADLVRAMKTFVAQNSREGLAFSLDEFRFAYDPRGFWWASAHASAEGLDPQFVIALKTVGDSYWRALDMGSGVSLADYPVPSPLAPKWW